MLQGEEIEVNKSLDATINASCCGNGNGSWILGLDSHLESNHVHWYCVIKHDSHHNEDGNDTHSWHECMQNIGGITLH